MENQSNWVDAPLCTIKYCFLNGNAEKAELFSSTLMFVYLLYFSIKQAY